jgi:LmbE family N-acetylglucosaminyl deacetylase
MKILIIAAHPDDEVLGMGGTIKKYTKNGDDVKIVIMATGIHSRRSSNYENITSYDVDEKTLRKMKKQVTELQKDAKKAAKILGVSDIEFLHFPDNEMDTVSNLEITKVIEKIISQFKPSIVYTHSQFDINIDHRMCYFATLTATRPKSGTFVNQVYSFEVPSSTEWYFPSSFSPNTFVDISNELNAKIKSLQAYKNEIEKFPHPRSSEALKAISQKWGSVSGFKNAEAFTLIRELKSKV